MIDKKAVKDKNPGVRFFMIKKLFVIVGLGGVGGYFGFKINQVNESSGKYTVSFVARGETYDKVKRTDWF